MTFERVDVLWASCKINFLCTQDLFLKIILSYFILCYSKGRVIQEKLVSSWSECETSSCLCRQSHDSVEDQLDSLTNMLQEALKTGSQSSLPGKSTEDESASSSQSSFIDHGSTEGNVKRSEFWTYRSQIKSDSGNDSLSSSPTPSVEGTPIQMEDISNFSPSEYLEQHLWLRPNAKLDPLLIKVMIQTGKANIKLMKKRFEPRRGDKTKQQLLLKMWKFHLFIATRAYCNGHFLSPTGGLLLSNRYSEHPTLIHSRL